MNVRVRLFAAAKQTTGREAVELEMPPDATIGQVRNRLAEQIPELADLFARAMFAIGTQYATDAEEIPPNVEVACIPPVSGG